jgi:hypothetical protein
MPSASGEYPLNSAGFVESSESRFDGRAGDPMSDWPVREPWFLRGRRSVLQRAVLISVALAVVAMIATWVAVVGCVVLYFGTVAVFGNSPFEMACVMGLASGLIMGLPLQLGFQKERIQVLWRTIGLGLTTTAVFWTCLEVEPRLLTVGLSDHWVELSWMSVCAISYAFVFNAWLPRSVGRNWVAGLTSTFLPALLPHVLFPLERGFNQLYAWFSAPELARMIVMSCLWGVPNMAILVPWGLPWWQAPPEEVTPE